jgi:integrase
MQREWGQLREATNEVRRKQFKLIEPELGHLHVDQLTVPLIDGWLYEAIAERGNVYAVHGAFYMLRTMLSLAQKRRLVSMNAAAAVTYPTKALKRRDKRVLTPAQYQQLLAACEHPHERCLIRMLCEAGLRRGEAIELRVGDLDLEAGMVHVQRRAYILKDGTRDIDLPKNRRTRIVAINESLAGELAQQVEGKAPDVLVWTRNTCRTGGEDLPHTGASLTQRIVRLGEQAGLLKDNGRTFVGPQMLRATGASLAVAAGVNPLVARDQLGHRKMHMTDTHYLHLPDVVMLKAYGEAFNPVES